jgi:large conductance mechanosensitive channel
MLKEFREFISRGNVMDMAVGIIIGAAFTAIVNSVVEDLINPIISLFTGGLDFSALGFRLGEGENAAVFAYGSFITAIIEFLIIAWAVFLLVKGVNRIKEAAESLALMEADEEAPAGPSEKDLLIEIRDVLKQRGA